MRTYIVEYIIVYIQSCKTNSDRSLVYESGDTITFQVDWQRSSAFAISEAGPVGWQLLPHSLGEKRLSINDRLRPTIRNRAWLVWKCFRYSFLSTDSVFGDPNWHAQGVVHPNRKGWELLRYPGTFDPPSIDLTIRLGPTPLCFPGSLSLLAFGCSMGESFK